MKDMHTPDPALDADTTRGLSAADAAARIARFGPNELPPPRREGWPLRLFRQLREPMALLLMAAAAVAGIGLKERADGIAILAIVALNAVIGLVQEGKAERALEALRSMETPTARVRREGADLIVQSRDIVPGDLVLLASGDRVPADLRLAQTASLEVDESLLTGESLPVRKDAGAEPKGGGVADQTNVAFSGTLVTRGSARGIAIETGAGTQIGAIAMQVSARQPPTPLQRELGRMTARLGAISIAVAAGVFALTLARMGITHESLQQSFLAAVALAVAAVPEGLATVVTVALALGVRRMAAHQAIVRRLPAVETLGATTVIATDKTGTLTENRLRLEFLAAPGGAPASPDRLDASIANPILEIAAICNDASLDPPAGDPLDVALLEAIGAGRVASLRSAHPRISEVPFDSVRKRMTTVHRTPEGIVLAVKGAPEHVLPLCGVALSPAGGLVPLSKDERAELSSLVSAMAERGVRVLAVARRAFEQPPENIDDAENGLTLLGLAGLADPVRPEAAPAVSEARAAGIHVMMVSGDHAGTARAIARDVGMIAQDSPVLTGDDLRERGIPADPAATPVYARVDPQQKLALVEAMQARGDVVAVTGDGVNDAPALRRAEIGVAMGRVGSDVAREASDMVVTDDNLATIVRAVREGRGIYDNIRKVVDYLVAGNLSEIAVVVSALLLFPALGVPLLPLQLLWVNLLTDGLPALALSVDPADPGLMSRPPRPRSDGLLAGTRLTLLLWRGLLIATSAVASLAVAHFLWKEPWAHARATMFTVLVVAHLLWAFAARLPRYADETPLARELVANHWLLVAVATGLLLQFAVIAIPAAHGLFGTAPLTAREVALTAIGGSLPVAVMLIMRRTMR